MKPNPNVIFRRLGDEIVLFHLETDRFYELNGTAARFWELLASGCTAVEAQDQMAGEFEVDRNLLAGEAQSLISSLQRENLISVED